MILTRALLLATLAVGLAGLRAETGTEEPEWREDWRNTSLALIEAVARKPDEQGVMKIGMLARLSRDKRPLSQEVAVAAREAILSIPDHAAYFERALEGMRPLVREGEPIDNFSDERQRLFSMLQEIPSPQVVELLIKSLDDPSGEVRNEHDRVLANSNQTKAMYTIVRTVEPLPLDRDNWGYYIPDLEALRKWGEQVRNGVRTFRFVGNPQLYDIHGPVEMPDTAPSKRRAPPSGLLPVEVSEGRDVPWVALGLAVLVLVAAAGFWWRHRMAK